MKFAIVISCTVNALQVWLMTLTVYDEKSMGHLKLLDDVTSVYLQQTQGIEEKVF